MDIIVKRFVDEEGKITHLPVKKEKRIAVLAYLADKFASEKNYTEKEVNGLIDKWHTFGDYFILRREMVDNELLCRTSDGSRYWRNKVCCNKN